MSTSHSSSQDTNRSAAEKRRKRRERNARSRTPEPKDIVSGAGHPLDPSVRRDLEEQLGHDFSQVRLHTDRDSAQLADMMGADAFAVGQDIFFREGTYRPGTADGQRLLAHELLHTVQNPHGLGALRAGRDLGAVSLPQEAIEREAESAARSSVLGALQESVRDEQPAAEVEEGQATPGWLRYATVDADRRRMEQLDPATLVDRLANGVLRSLRGDPEDRSGRARLQLARMSPELQESVLDRLEVRLLTPEVDRLLDLVDEVEEGGPLPLVAAATPESVQDEAEVIAQERTQQNAAAADKREQDEQENDDRRKRAQQRKDADPAGDGGPERDAPSTAGGAPRAPAASTSTGSQAAGQAAAQDKQAASARQKDQAQANQEDKEADAQAAQKDKDAENSARGQDEDGEERSDEEASAAEKDAQGGEGEQEDATAKDKGSDAEAVDKSDAEPGEKDRTGQRDDERRKGDPENEEDADDEPLGLEEESEELDEDDGLDAEEDEDDGLEAADEEDADSADTEEETSAEGLSGTSPSAAKQRNRNDAPDADHRYGPPGVLDSPVDRSQSDEAVQRAKGDAHGAGSGRASSEGTQEPDDRIATDLDIDKSIEQEIGPEPDEKADDKLGAEPGEKGSGPSDPEDAEREREQAEERKEDEEAKRRDDAARTASEGSGVARGPEDDTTAPGQLSKAEEDARKQAAASSPESSASEAASGSGPGAASGEGKSSEGSADKDASSSGGGNSGTRSGSGSSGGSDTESGSASGSATGSATGKDEGTSGGTPGGGASVQDSADTKAGTGTTGTAHGKETEAPGTAGTKDATQTTDVSEGKGPATTPGTDAGPDKASAPGPVNAPKVTSAPGATAPLSAAAKNGAANGGAPKDAQPPKPGPGKPTARPKAAAAPGKRQAARQAAKNVRRGGGGGGGRTAAAPARGGRGGGGRAASGPAKPKKDAPAPDVSRSTPEAGLATISKLKPYQMLETFKGVDTAVGTQVGKERAALRKGPPQMERPIGSPRTLPGGPTPAAPGTYTNAKVSRTDAAKGKTPEIEGEERPKGQPPGVDVPEPSWWDILLTIGVEILKRIFPFDDLIDSVMNLPTTDDGLKGARVGNAPGLPLQDDSDPQRTDEQNQKLDERKDELHQAGREDAARPMGEDQIYPDAPHETLKGKVPGGGKKGGKQGGGRKVAAGGVPIESASAVAEHDRGPQIQAGFAQGQQKMGQERKAKDEKAKNDKKKHDQDLKREVDASTKKQAGAREKGQSDIADARDKWRKEQDDKVADIDDKKGKKYDKVRKDIDDKNEQTDKDVDKRTEDDNKKIDDEQTNSEKDAKKKQEDKKKEAENGGGGFLERLKEWWENLKKDIEEFFARARKAVTDLIDKFKREVFELIDKARNWVVEQINDFADALIAFGDELLADYPAMRDKWRNTINAGRDWAVQKVNEAADALKEVAGKLLDGLCGALLEGLDLLEGGLKAAVDVAETVTVEAVEFGKGVVQALGDWAAIFNDIVSDPGGWISKAGAAAETGAKEHLFNEIKSAVKEWVKQKVQEIIGIPMEDFQALIEGGVSAEEMGKMAWDEAVPQLPIIIGVMVVEKVVAKLIPGAGWAMAIIDALKAAWGALSEILAAFGLFMDFLKSVKSGNGALPFAKAVAAGVVALLELVYQALVEGIGRFMGGVAKRLGDMLKDIRGKKKGPGAPEAPGRPGAPNRPGDPSQTNTPGRPAEPGRPGAPGPAANRPHRSEKPGEPGGQSDKPGQRPAPRKPSPDKTSRPEQGPRPEKRPSPEKKPDPKQQPKPKHKKKPDEHERRDDGREVNAARRRLRDAKRKQRDDDKAGPTKRHGPARDTLRKKRDDDPTRPDKRDQDKSKNRDKKKDEDKDLLNKKPTDKKIKKQDTKGHDKDKHKKDDKERDRDRKKKLTDKKRTRRKPESRTRRKLRRARQTIKSAVSRARRAARRLFGKGRKLGRKLNNRTHRLRDQWRRQRDRLRRNHDRRRNRRNPEPQREPEGRRDYDLPKVRFRTDNGEIHTLQFDGKGRSASLAVHSNMSALQAYFASWQRDITKIKDAPERKAEQEEALKAARARGAMVEGLQDQLPQETPRPSSPAYGTPVYLGSRGNDFQGAMRVLKYHMDKLAELLAERYSDNGEPLPDTILPPFSDGPMASSFQAHYIKAETPRGTDTGHRPFVNPVGWKYITDREMSEGSAWVRMHMLPAPLGGHATTSNLVPARGEENLDAAHEVEHPAALAVGKEVRNKQHSPAPERMIWYDVSINYWSTYRGFPSSLKMKWGGYSHKDGKWTRRGGGTSWEEQPEPPDSTALPVARINRDTASRIARITHVSDYFATAIVKLRKEKGMKFLGLGSLLFALRQGYDLTGNGRTTPPTGGTTVKRQAAIDALKEADKNQKLDFSLFR
ncbi:eCIS core domain-containing protein [Streptomyces sclerotialus]|uniref:eCIS core domain-containing protein n=1 Tax=Streptomyces sclerotialus TaxID=1957 RepID=UPI0004CB4342